MYRINKTAYNLRLYKPLSPSTKELYNSDIQPPEMNVRLLDCLMLPHVMIATKMWRGYEQQQWQLKQLDV